MTAETQPGRPAISVAMCTYNGSRFLDEQLSSIRKQSRLPNEMIVCDDCSQDDTVSKLQHFARSVPFLVRIVINENNIGSTRSFEQAISLCGGDVIVLSDQDDVWKAARLEKTEEAFVQHPSAGIVFADAEIIGPDSSPTGLRLWKAVRFSYLQRFRIRRKRAAQALLQHNVVTGAAMAFRATLRDMVLPIPDGWIQDGWIGLIGSFSSDIFPVSEPLIEYRRHVGQQIGPSDHSFFSQMTRARTTPLSFYRQEAERYQAAYERLFPHAETEKQKKVLTCIAAKVRHLKVRGEMPRSRLKRIPLVAGEMIGLRYLRYSQGLRSALKDLFY